MIELLQNLQSSEFAEWVRISVWGYQIILTLHSVGLAFLVGFMVVIDMRILGLASGVPLPAVRPAMIVIWLAFVLNAVTGAMLFTADAERFYSNTMFRFKIASIFIGMTLAVITSTVVLRAPPPMAPQSRIASNPTGGKILAACSLAVWAAAIIFGRLIAYHG